MRPTHLALAALAVATTLASAQNGVQANVPGAGFDTPATATPTLHVYSRETIVDVLVTDDKGQPVTGLKQSDFTILEDGHSQPIRSFHEFDKHTPPAPARTLPPNTYTNSTALPVDGPVQIFLFDLLGTGPAVMQRAKKYIADGVRSMPAGTQVAVFELSPNKQRLLLLQGVTTDCHAAATAIDNLDVEWIRNAPPPPYPIAVVGSHQIADYVAAIHGRKNLVWIKPGAPLPILRDGGYAWGVRDMTAVHRYMDLYDIFTGEQIAIYPFDPRGLHNEGPTAYIPDPKSENKRVPNVHPFDAALGFLAAAENPLLEAAVADGTGGATSNSNDYKATIASIVDGTEHSYALSYVPPRPDVDGHFHPIQIKVDRPGVHLTYQTGYNDEQPLPPDAILKQGMIQGPMRFGAVPATQILFDLHVQPANMPASIPEPPPTKGAPYDTTFIFDPTQIALAQNPDGTRTASIELDLGAFDFYGKLVAARSQTFKITVIPAQYESFYRKPIQFPLAIDLPQGQLTLRAGVFDTSANKAGTLEVPITVPKR